MIIDVNKFKSLLKEKGITKSELAEKLGISSRTIAKIAKCENINQNVVLRIVEFLNCSVEDIFSSNIILETLQKEKLLKLSGGLYHQTQVKLTYNSNHIEGSKLTEEQTRFIFETKTLGDIGTNIPLDDVIETNNHFRCIDYVIDAANEQLSEELILTLQLYLKEGTEHSKQFGAGKYKTMPNVVGGNDTTAPDDVSKEMKNLLTWYNKIKKPLFENIVEFHYRFEKIHPFQDGNGRIGRLIAFKECLKNNIVPFYIDDKFKFEYYRGLKEWQNEKGYLLETCRFGQDLYRELLNYFKIEY